MIDQSKVDACGRITKMVYSRVCRDLGYNMHQLKKHIIYEEITEEEYLEKKEIIDQAYCEAICKLSTRVLDLILQIHDSGQLRRAPRTRDAIANELLERTLHENKPKETS